MYKTIVIDPPWDVKAGRSIGLYRVVDGKQPFGVRDNRARSLAYASMTVEEMAALTFPHAADSHLYLWTINRYLADAFYLLRRWGYDYSTTLVWAKRPMGGGLGGCYGLATEFILFGRAGTCPARSRVGRNWFDWKRPYDERGKPRHSAKPPEFYQMVEQISPGPYLELFARNPRTGWHVWGNEVISDLQLQEVPSTHHV